MTQMIEVGRLGGPEVLRTVEREVGDPGPGQVRLRQEAIGVNFIDTYFRSGLYRAEPPFVPGNEAAGVVEAVGPGVTDLRPGDRVGYCWTTLGGYAAERLVEAEMLVPLPDPISPDTAAAAMLKGCTVEYLVERCGRVQAGMTVLVHAAAGGVGLIAVQWLKAVGATVIGTAGSRDKAAVAEEAGADHVILYRDEPVGPRVRALTGGSGVPVVLDGVGADTWGASLESLARRGLLVSFGNASGPVPPVELLELSRRGSLFVTRPRLADYATTPEERRHAASRLFELILAGKVKVRADQRFTLGEAADAHRAIEGRHTTGSTILVPG